MRVNITLLDTVPHANDAGKLVRPIVAKVVVTIDPPGCDYAHRYELGELACESDSERRIVDLLVHAVNRIDLYEEAIREAMAALTGQVMCSKAAVTTILERAACTE